MCFEWHGALCSRWWQHPTSGVSQWSQFGSMHGCVSQDHWVRLVQPFLQLSTPERGRPQRGRRRRWRRTERTLSAVHGTTFEFRLYSKLRILPGTAYVIEKMLIRFKLQCGTLQDWPALWSSINLLDAHHEADGFESQRGIWISAYDLCVVNS